MIRKAVREDLPRILEIERESFKEPWPPSIFWNSLGSDGFMVYSSEGEIIAYALIDKESPIPRGHLASIAVAREHRRKGIASRLLAACESYARRRGAKTIRLEVREHNLGAIEFYLKHGYNIIGRMRYYYITEGAIVMEKVLSAWKEQKS